MLYDAIAVLTDGPLAGTLSDDVRPQAHFVSDAYAHCKFVGYVNEAVPCLEAAGIGQRLDEGFVALDDDGGVAAFVKRCRELRYWQRRSLVPQP